MLRKVPAFVLLAICAWGCASKNYIPAKSIKSMLFKRAILNDHFTGFVLYDLDNHKTIYELNAGKYFTPASNTKLFTFYTCLNMLGDSIPSIKYVVKGDSLLFWGTGDPAFLHPDLKGNTAFGFLKNQDKKLFFCTGNYQNSFYGNGWAWDDYNDYYQAEINNLPVYGNLAYFYADSSKIINAQPAYFKFLLTPDSAAQKSRYRIRRDFLTNTFYLPATPPPAKYRQWIPYKISDELTVKLLEDTLKKQVGLLYMPTPANAKTFYSINADTVYRHMLQSSDNFIAEQLLLVCSVVKYDYLNSDSVRQYAANTFLKDLPDEPQWSDGSGLSRLNLFTPRSIIALLEKIRFKVHDDKKLFSLMPNGGISGTLRTAYKTDNGVPFVFAKTGSLSNNYNQSGYMVTRKGHKLAFCFMNNNYTGATRALRDTMVKIITNIHEKY